MLMYGVLGSDRGTANVEVLGSSRARWEESAKG